MSDHFQTIVDLDATEVAAPELAARVAGHLEAAEVVLPETLDQWGLERHRPPGPAWSAAVAHPRQDDDFLELGWNGLVVEADHKVFGLGQVEGLVHCPACSHEVDPDVWGEAAGEWFERSGPAMVACPACASSSPLPTWTGEVAFAELGFTFWNWPKLSDTFVAELAEVLGGHRLVVVAAKL